MGLRHPVRLVQTERVEARRHQPEHGRIVAGTHQGQGGPARAVRPRDRRRADHPRSRRHPRARDSRWNQAGADRGDQLRLHLRRGERENAVEAHDSVLRNDGPVGALQGRLGPQHQGQPRALGSVRPGQPGSTEQPGIPALRPEQGLQPIRRHRREAPGEGHGDEGGVRRGGQEVPGLPAGRVGGGARRPASNITAGRTEFVYTRPMVGLPQGDSPFLLDASFTVTADIEVRSAAPRA